MDLTGLPPSEREAVLHAPVAASIAKMDKLPVDIAAAHVTARELVPTVR